jgi:O-antigen/teichoic acid export membrane protein
MTVVKESPFLINNLIFFSGSLVVAALNYLYYPILGRMLDPIHFGEVQTLLSLYAQAAVFLNILTYVTIHVTVNTDDPETRNHLLLRLERIALLGGYGALAVALVCTPLLRSFLNFTNPWPFVALVIALAISIPMALRMAFLRGKKLFLKATLMDGIGSFAKIVLSVALVVVGWKTFGAIMGLALSQIISLAFGVAWVRRAGFSGFGWHKINIPLSRLRPQFAYAAGAFLATSTITAIMGLDIIAVKHYFSPEVAGTYAGMATIARIVFYITAPFMGVLLTMVSINQPQRKNLLQLGGSIALISMIGGSALLVLALFPDFFVRVLVGPKYLAYASYLPRLSLAMLLLGIANALLMYQVTMRQYRVALYATVLVVLSVGLVYWNHTTVVSVINDIVCSSVAVLIIAAGHTLYSARNSGRNERGHA